jgi:hypothetical protein
MRTAVHVAWFAVCAGVLIATGAAVWIVPPWTAMRERTSIPAVKPSQVAQVAIPVVQTSQVAMIPPLQRDASPQSASGATPALGLTVAQWGFSHDLGAAQSQVPQDSVPPGQPLYFWMTLDGTQMAIDRMQTGPLTIQVHWVRENATPGAPNLVTDLTIGRPDMAATLEGAVRRSGYFEWHSWARKDTLSPGTWTVSLTYPDGQPLLCGRDAEPCHFTINVG